MEDLDDSMDDVFANIEMPEIAHPSTSKQSELAQPSTSKTTAIPVATDKIKNIEEVEYFQTNAVLVHSNQRGNPLLKAITNVRWEYHEKIIPDYVIGKSGK
jgi:hypothetical protein